MPEPTNAMEIFKQLPRTNCGECGVPACLAFAAAVFRGDNLVEDCPHVNPDTIERLGWVRPVQTPAEQEEELALEPLKKSVASIDFSSSAERLDARFSGGRLTINCLGKDFSVDTEGNVFSDCHVHHWIVGPLLSYVITCAGKPLSGKWVQFKELKKGGADWSRLFRQRCEKPLKQIIDSHADLFELMIQIFNGEPVPTESSADISIVLYPLPKVPILFLYWSAEDGIDSQLSVLFDSSADANLGIEAIYSLAVGLVIMFDRIVDTHARKAS
jgi:hypothetical protein